MCVCMYVEFPWQNVMTFYNRFTPEEPYIGVTGIWGSCRMIFLWVHDDDDDDEYIYVFKTPNIRRTQQRDRDADCYL